MHGRMFLKKEIFVYLHEPHRDLELLLHKASATQDLALTSGVVVAMILQGGDAIHNLVTYLSESNEASEVMIRIKPLLLCYTRDEGITRWIKEEWRHFGHSQMALIEWMRSSSNYEGNSFLHLQISRFVFPCEENPHMHFK